MRYLVGLLLLIGASLAFLYFRVGVLPIYKEEVQAKGAMYYYDTPGQTIENVALGVFYFVPKNKTAFVKNNWKAIVEGHLEKLRAFHEFQFRGKSSLEFIIYPEPIIGLQESSEYDTTVPLHGDTATLIKVEKELNDRIFTKSGDLFNKEFLKADRDSYLVSMIIYEGIGSGGKNSAALISSSFLTRNEHQPIGTTFLTHEFYHTLGIPEGYDIPTNTPLGDDIMGLGRTKPLEATYISEGSLRRMGM